MDREAWRATGHGVTKNGRQLNGKHYASLKWDTVELVGSSRDSTGCGAMEDPDPSSKATLWLKAQHEGCLDSLEHLLPLTVGRL